MARFYKTGGAGGGVSSDELTGTLGDVIKGVTVVASDTNDEIGTGTLELTGDAATGDVVANKTFYTTDPKTKNTGTLADKNGTTQSATPTLDDTNSRVVMPVPETGRYDTSSKLYAAYSVIASLIGLTGSKIVSGNTILGVPGTATGDATLDSAGDMLNGVIGYGKNGAKYIGNIASLAGGTKTPTTSKQTIACKNKYMTSDIVIPAFSLPAASSIKKGVTVTIYGKSVTGTFEGYVSDNLFLYNAGTWSNISTTGLTNCTAASTYLTMNGYITRTNATVDITNYKYIKVKINPGYTSGNEPLRCTIAIQKTTGTDHATYVYKCTPQIDNIAIFDVSQYTGFYYIELYTYIEINHTTITHSGSTIKQLYLSKT